MPPSGHGPVMLARTPEPELMADVKQARVYAAADFEASHGAIIDALWARLPGFPRRGRIVDLGCGAADIAVRIARARPECSIDAVDGAEAMLAEARARLAREGLTGRVALHRARLPLDPLPRAPYDGVVSNSLLHHLHDPAAFWDALAGAAAPGAPVFLADLARPADAATVDALVARMTAGEPERLQRDFRASLHAAHTPAEVRGQLAAAGLDLTVEMLDEHHLLVWGQR